MALGPICPRCGAVMMLDNTNREYCPNCGCVGRQYMDTRYMDRVQLGR